MAESQSYDGYFNVRFWHKADIQLNLMNGAENSQIAIID